MEVENNMQKSSNVIQSSRALDQTIDCLLRDERNTDSFVHRSVRAGYIYVGDIVKEDEKVFFKKVRTSPDLRAKISKNLHYWGLEFGMKAVDWKQPSRFDP